MSQSRRRAANTMPPSPTPPPAAKPLPPWLRGLVIGAMVLGIVLRFTNVSHKAYWLDEAFTSFHISGYSDGEAIAQLVNGQIITNADLQRFQYPNEAHSAWDTVEHIALTAPELPPPYFLALRGWLKFWGQSITAIRLLSVTFGLLLLPAVYWLARQLFPGTWTGAIALALVSLSPFHLLYAQEARPYSLWAVLIVLSYGSLVRALARPTPWRWLLYAISLSLGLYCHLLHGLVVVSQALFMAIHQRWRWTPRLQAYGWANLGGLLLFAPWVFLALVHFDNFQTVDFQAANFQAADTGAIAPNLGLHLDLIKNLLKGWLKGWNLAYVDFNFDNSAGRGPRLGLATLLGLNLLWMALALVCFVKAAPRFPKQLLLVSVAVVAGILILPDFIIGGARSAVFRYWLPAILCGQLIAAYVLASWLQGGPRRWGRIILVALLALGLVSNGVMVMSWNWWSKDIANTHLALPSLVRAHALDPLAQGQPPLFVSDKFFVFSLAASHYLPNSAQWLLLQPGQQPTIPENYTRFYLYEPSPELQEQLALRYRLTPVDAKGQIWQVDRPLG